MWITLSCFTEIFLRRPVWTGGNKWTEHASSCPQFPEKSREYLISCFCYKRKQREGGWMGGRELVSWLVRSRQVNAWSMKQMFHATSPRRYNRWAVYCEYGNGRELSVNELWKKIMIRWLMNNCTERKLNKVGGTIPKFAWKSDKNYKKLKFC